MLRKIFLVLIFIASCVTSEKNISKRKKTVVTEIEKEGDKVTTNSSKEVSSSTSNISETSTNECFSLSDKKITMPMVFGDESFILTRFLSLCPENSDGNHIKQGSGFVVMGIPCSGGNGRMEYRGHAFAPKYVSYTFNNDCPMKFNAMSQVEKIVQSKLGLSSQEKLMALLPMNVRYWEIPGLADSAAGHVVELLSMESRQTLWTKWQKSEPIPVDLYGQENAWTETHQMYRVKGEIIPEGKNQEKFKLIVKSLEFLTDDMKSEVKSRCEQKIPKLPCGDIF